MYIKVADSVANTEFKTTAKCRILVKLHQLNNPFLSICKKNEL